MGARGIDIAWARPSVAEIKATGAHWVARYFSSDPTKNLKAAEVTAYPAAGLAIVVVWETTTKAAERGYQGGRADALAAETQRRGVGLPNDMPIHFAVDEDTDWPTVAQYFAGVASVIGKARTGIYAGIRPCTGAYNAGYRLLWQADAWSYGKWHPNATIRQTGGTCLGGSADYDTAMADDFGQFPRPNGDLVATQAEIDAIAKASANATAALLTDGPHRDTLAAANLYWLQRALDPTIPLDTKTGGWPANQAASVRAVVVAREAALNAAIAALTKAVGVGGITAAQITAAAQAGATAALQELGHALDGVKPPAAVAPADTTWASAPATQAAPATPATAPVADTTPAK